MVIIWKFQKKYLSFILKELEIREIVIDNAIKKNSFSLVFSSEMKNDNGDIKMKKWLKIPLSGNIYSCQNNCEHLGKNKSKETKPKLSCFFPVESFKQAPTGHGSDCVLACLS